MTLAIGPIIGSQSGREQPLPRVIGAFGINTADEKLSAGAATGGEIRSVERIILARLAAVVAQIAAGFPAEIAEISQHRGVETEADRGNGILIVRRRCSRLARSHRNRIIGKIAVDDPALRAPADAVLSDRFGKRETGRFAARFRFRALQSRTERLVVVADARSRDHVVELRLCAQSGRAVIEPGMRVGRTLLRRQNRYPSVGALAIGAAEEIDLSDRGATGRADTIGAEISGGGIGFRNAVCEIAFAQKDRARQCAGAVGPGACTALDLGAADAFIGKLTPDHPIAEWIVQRHAVKQHQRASGAGRRDRAQRNSVGSGIRAKARGTAKQRKTGHLLQRSVKLVKLAERRLIQVHNGERGIADRFGQLGAGYDDSFDTGAGLSPGRKHHQSGQDRCSARQMRPQTSRQAFVGRYRNAIHGIPRIPARPSLHLF